MFDSTSNPEYSQFIALSKYARWLPELGRRENWGETVERYVSFFSKKFPLITRNKIPGLPSPADEIYDAIYDLKVMPSMRALMTAGEALDRDNVAGFNCSYKEAGGAGEKIEVLTPEMEAAGIDTPVSICVNKPSAFDEIMYILMCGTGVGFSCERQVVTNLPVVGHKCSRKIYFPTEDNFPGINTQELSYITKKNSIVVKDSKYGWASALRILLVELYNSNFTITYDTRQVRAAGTPLKTFGGRASGPQPLIDLFEYCIALFKEANGRKLTSIEVHGLVCKIAEIVVVGGVRRSALISLSNLSDDRMRKCKSGAWYLHNPEYALANNSVAYSEKPSMEVFMREWLSLVESKSGERGIFNREASRNQAGVNGRRALDYYFGTNPCSEIILKNEQFCNLSEVIVRHTDTFADLCEKVRLATIIGTLQCSLTDFKYLNSNWKKNTEEEALLGVSLTGIMDHPLLCGARTGMIPKWWGGVVVREYDQLPVLLERLKQVAIDTNKIWAPRLGVNQSVAITCVKPSGTVSQLTDTASGIHPRFSEFYIRTVRSDVKDPLARMMIDQGFPHAPDVMNPNNTVVFSFPMRAPSTAIFRNDMTALDQLEHWLIYQRYWCEHKPSITVYCSDEEWLDVGAWVWDHFDEISGISFLPYDNGTYRQAPYQEISEQEYNDWVEIMPKDMDWGLIGDYEKEDNTKGSQTLACSADSCEIVDLT
jgi:ribonucleoside-triphosphate reductase